MIKTKQQADAVLVELADTLIKNEAYYRMNLIDAEDLDKGLKQAIATAKFYKEQGEGAVELIEGIAAHDSEERYAAADVVRACREFMRVSQPPKEKTDDAE